MTRTGRTRRRAARPILAVLAALALGNALSASTLPSRVYTTLEGLPGNHVNAITRDAHGYLWFATDRGLARFDGTRFTAFGRGDGLPDGAVNDVIETKDGALWVAADTGVYRLDPASGRGGAAPPFSAIRWQVARAPVPVVLAPRDDGGVRVGTQDGVFDTKGNVLVPSDPVLPREFWDDHSVDALAQTAAGRWTGTLNTLWLEPRPAGTTRGFTVPDAPLGERISALLRDARGRLWIGTWQGLFRIEEGEVRDPLEPRNRVSTDPVESLFERDDGTVIAVSMHALTALRDGAPPVRTPAAELGALFEDVELRCAAEDTAGNLWIGTAGGGAIRLDREGFVRYGREDGLASSRAPAIFARRDGTPCAELVSRDRIFVACYDGARFRSVEPKPIRDRVVTGWGTSQLALEDTKGRLWVPTGEGLLRYPARPRLEDIEHTPPERVFDRHGGLPVESVFRLFRAKDGAVWISTASARANLLARWDPGEDRVDLVPEADAPDRTRLVTAIGESPAGDVWVGTNGNGLWSRRGSRFGRVSDEADLSRCWITGIFRDRIGRLWVSTDRFGVFRFDAPDSPTPAARRLGTADGLSSLDVQGIAQDRFDRIYVLTLAGVDRLGPRPGDVEHFTTADGLPGGTLVALAADGAGRIWVSGDGGISILTPVAPSPFAAVRVVFEDVQVSGERIPIPIRGKRRISDLALPAGRNSLRFEIASLAWEARRPLAYRYRLDPRSPWSPVPGDRTIVLPRLAPGRYRVEIAGAGPPVPGDENAVAEFSIAAPLWRRPEFILFLVVAAAAAALRLHQARLAQLMRLERIRTRIAADLHDDIGAGLSEVSVLAEVVRGRLGARDSEAESQLGQIAQTARHLVDSMGDIVWAIDPRRDDLASLIARLRHFAATFAEAAQIGFVLDTGVGVADSPLAAGRRRDLYLLLKEAVHNALRHAGARRVEMRITVERGVLRGEVLDDGSGFDPSTARNGHGLDSMRERAKALGGKLDVASVSGSGTRITVSVPVGRNPA